MDKNSLFLENLEKALANNIYISNPLDEFFKHGSVAIDDLKIVRELKQFVCTPWETNNNPAIQNPTMWMPETENEFNIEIIKKLTAIIKEWSIKVAFAPLVLPRGVIKASLLRHNNIIGRYIEDYQHGSDSIIKRWDFLIQKLD